MKLLHIAAESAIRSIWNEVFMTALSGLGALTILENGAAMTDDERARHIRDSDILLTCWGTAAVPMEIARNRGRLQYICHITGGMRGAIPLEIIDAGIPVTNWGTAPANGVAEGAMALLLTVLKDLTRQTREIQGGGWAMDMTCHGGSLWGLNVGVYGCGAIGQRFIELLRPFGAVVRVFDPFAPMPEGCLRVDSLEELFRTSDAVAIHAGLSDDTRNTVTADLLALLPRHGILINTARGGIVDQDALFAELASGRLRAGLDVLEPDGPLPPDHPARHWDNLVLSCHHIEYPWPSFGQPPTRLTPMQEVALDNLRRHIAGEPLRFLMTHDHYLLST
jgi:phosphoglycerate dehydrogenase-like enzyme